MNDYYWATYFIDPLTELHAWKLNATDWESAVIEAQAFVDEKGTGVVAVFSGHPDSTIQTAAVKPRPKEQ